jgi:hypothetical protein
MTQPQPQIISPGADIMDFSAPKNVSYFTIDQDVFELVPGVPAITLMEFAQLSEQVGETNDPAKAKDMFMQMFTLVLTDRSAQRLLDRMASKLEPVTMDQVEKIIPYVLEKVGLRPTGQSGSSSDTPATPASGPSSTENAPPTESTSDLSTLHGSWTPSIGG